MLSDPPVSLGQGFPSVARDLLREPSIPHPEGKEGLNPRPNPEAVIRLVDNLRKIIFPGYLEAGSLDPEPLKKSLILKFRVFTVLRLF